MVAVPVLPGVKRPDPPPPPSKLKEALEVISNQEQVKERVSNVSRAYALLDTFTPEQKAELYIWLAEHPLPDIDPVRVAIASFNALHEDELPLFFEQLRQSLDPDLWDLLTGE